MKLEKRGKYAGVKIHLDKEEIEKLLLMVEPSTGKLIAIPTVLRKMVGALMTMIQKDPSVLHERSEGEIKAELENEFESAKAKLAALANHTDWTTVKVIPKGVK